MAGHTTVRFTDQDLALLDAIQKKTGIVSRTEILRRAIRLLAEQERIVLKRRGSAEGRGR
jgi:metal-responsive CopG/Arc/MetJ family transcriptional regulator